MPLQLGIRPNEYQSLVCEVVVCVARRRRGRNEGLNWPAGRGKGAGYERGSRLIDDRTPYERGIEGIVNALLEGGGGDDVGGGLV